MASFREKPGKDYIYHVYNRGVEKRDIFTDYSDYQRFISALYFFNDSAPTTNTSRLCEVGLRTNGDERNKLVEVLAFVLMPNHFHLLVKSVKEDGLTEFMRKIGTGYTNYFNIKHDRVGSLFQNKYKMVRIDKDEQLSYIPYYIHLNPIELVEPGWKEKVVNDFERAFNFLKSYRWSSFRHYIGQDHFSELIDGECLKDYLGKPEDYGKDTLDWIREVATVDFSDLTLE